MFCKLLTIFFVVELSYCRWIVEVELLNYLNAESKAIGNINSGDECCDPPASDEELCSDPCDTYFTFCLQPMNEVGLSSCRYGRYDSQEVGGDDVSFERGTAIDRSITNNPLIFTGQEWPENGMAMFLVFAYDNDTLMGSGTADYDLIGTAAVPLILTNNDDIASISVSSRFYKLSMDYSTECAMDQYGPQCSVECTPMDNSQGHYSCGSEGNVVCLQGFTGVEVNCTIDTCVPQCGGNSYCNATFVCVCSAGWTGSGCERPLCTAVQCSNGGVCMQPDTCLCAEGWNGSGCDTSTTGYPTFSSTVTVSSPSSPTLVTRLDSVGSTNDRVVIGCVVATLLVLGSIALALAVILIIYVRKKYYSIDQFSKSAAAKDGASRSITLKMLGEGDNPTYSPTFIMGSPPALMKPTTPLSGLDNPLYSNQSTSCSNIIIAGYSLVSLPEVDEPGPVYYSSADILSSTPQDEKPYYDSIRTTSNLRAHLRSPHPLSYSQPVLSRQESSNGCGNSDEYDYPDARSFVKKMKELELSCDTFHENYEP